MFYYSSGRSGGGDVGAGAQGVVLGILQGTKVGGKEALETISATSSSVVKGTSDIAGKQRRVRSKALSLEQRRSVRRRRNRYATP